MMLRKIVGSDPATPDFLADHINELIDIAEKLETKSLEVARQLEMLEKALLKAIVDLTSHTHTPQGDAAITMRKMYDPK